MSWEQFIKWRAYDETEPIGGARGDWQAASISSSLWNIAAMQAGSKKRFRTSDFLLEFGDDEKPIVEAAEPLRKSVYTQTWQEQKMIGMMYAAAFNSDEQKKKKR